MKKIRVNFYISDKHRKHLAERAKQYGITMSDCLRRLIDKDRESTGREGQQQA